MRRNQWSNSDRTPDAVFEDMEWLIRTGEHPDNIPRRLGWNSRRSLARYLWRHGRGDLAQAVEPYRKKAA